MDLAFRSIGNTLGQFLEVDLSFKQTRDLGAARILVNLNPKEGLADEMCLKYKDYEFNQTLDYEHYYFIVIGATRMVTLQRIVLLGIAKEENIKRAYGSPFHLYRKKRTRIQKRI